MAHSLFLLRMRNPCPSTYCSWSPVIIRIVVQVLHKHFLESSVRAHEPEQAQLFFIPVYLGRHYNWYWQQWSTPGNAWDVHADCLPQHTPAECFWEKWSGAKAVSPAAV